MKFIILLVVLLLIYLEFSLFVIIANQIGVLMTIILGFLSTIIGISLVKKQGLQHMLFLQMKQVPQNDALFGLIKGFTLLVAGFMLLIPGFITDAIGLLLLIPIVQRLVYRFYARKIKVNPVYHRYADENTFEGEYTRHPEPEQTKLDNNPPTQ
ncbi:FxsA family protein [Thorsellia anophelis]|uniref:UPF0716 protein FxsA n=1 Tax=Thorsellia anophelis DSM 18579 TaxID=1123402 RepID=A0A1I0DDM4_9GAMM|nr:FxsA family protein [Thorsellia anophelis]SET29836.1 UPF0716 protein FxsA [Thorsellia anophelis DSM 18579]